MTESYRLSLEIPGSNEYRALRAAAGLTPRSKRAADVGLPHTAAAAVIRDTDGRAVAMARAVGDGLVYSIVDVAVDPAHQGRGLGKRVMQAVMQRVSEIAPAEAYVSLIADGKHIACMNSSAFDRLHQPRSEWPSGSAGPI